MDKDKVLNIIKYVMSTVFILGLLIALIIYVYSFNNNFRKYEFKLTNNALILALGNEGEVPILSIDGDTVDKEDYIFTSTDPSVVTVSDNGRIVPIKTGSTVIIVKAKKSNQKEVLNVNVISTANVSLIEDINIKNSVVNIIVGETYTVDYEIVPVGAKSDKMAWSSSNTSIASVDNGVIVGKGEGTCIVYVKNGDITKEISINVTNS